MARVLENYQFPSKPAKRSLLDKNPNLRLWLNGQTWELVEDDFRIKPSSFRMVLYRSARMLNKRVKVRIEGNTIICRAMKRAGRKPKEVIHAT